MKKTVSQLKVNPFAVHFKSLVPSDDSSSSPTYEEFKAWVESPKMKTVATTLNTQTLRELYINQIKPDPDLRKTS